MFIRDYDVIVIGGGPAGLAAAISAKKQGVNKVVIVERESALGGILKQCIHPGFGLEYFDEELTGPEYAQKFIDQVSSLNIDVLLETMVLELNNNTVYATNKQNGICRLKAKSIVLAMGCRERTRGALGIPGSRPAGILTAGTAQKFINIQGNMIGNDVVILGSGDIGMIMARRLTWEGVNVKGVVEILPYLTGLVRNRVQCLDDYDIPLLFNHTVTNIFGKKRVEGVEIAEVDSNLKPKDSTKKKISCDTLLLSVGLIPENELSKTENIKLNPTTNGPVVNQFMQTSKPNIFSCGNVAHVNDLVDNVTIESEIAGKFAALSTQNNLNFEEKEIRLKPGKGINSVYPQKLNIPINLEYNTRISYRVEKPARNVTTKLIEGDEVIYKENKIKVNPGKMNYFELRKKELKNINDNLKLILGEG